MFKLVLEKAEEPEIKLQTSIGTWKKQESSRKHLLLLYWLCQSFWLCGSQQTVENSQRDRNSRPPDLPPEKSLCKSRSNRTGRGTTDCFQIGKGVCQGCILPLCWFNYMQSTSCKMLGWMKHKLESRFLGEISITSDIQMTPHLWQSKEELKNLLMKVKEKSEKAGLKFNIQKTKIMESSPITSWQIDGEKWKQWETLFWGAQNHCRWWLQPWN